MGRGPRPAEHCLAGLETNLAKPFSTHFAQPRKREWLLSAARTDLPMESGVRKRTGRVVASPPSNEKKLARLTLLRVAASGRLSKP